jgi:hypothetical protein
MEIVIVFRSYRSGIIGNVIAFHNYSSKHMTRAITCNTVTFRSNVVDLCYYGWTVNSQKFHDELYSERVAEWLARCAQYQNLNYYLFMKNKLGFCNTPGDLIIEMYCSVTTNTCEYRRGCLHEFSPLNNLSLLVCLKLVRKVPLKGQCSETFVRDGCSGKYVGYAWT